MFSAIAVVFASAADDAAGGEPGRQRGLRLRVATSLGPE